MSRRDKNRVIIGIIFSIFAIIITGKSLDIIRGGPSQKTHALRSITRQARDIDTSPVSSTFPMSQEILTSLATLTNSSSFISGQHIGTTNNRLDETYQKSVVELKKITGKTPGILSADYYWEAPPKSYSEVNAVLAAHYSKGGLVTINMHPGNPFIGGLYKIGTGSHTFNDLFIDGTNPNKSWNATLKSIGDGLEELAKANVVVLWRPLHEMNGNWFWWSFGKDGRITKDEYTKLWIYTYEYLVNERGLNNLLWIYSPNSAHNPGDSIDVLTLYPGDEFVDVVALDYYEDSLSQLNKNGSVEKLLSLNKPFGFAELGPRTRKGLDNIILAKEIGKSIPQTSFLIHWHTNIYGFRPTPRSILDNDKPIEYMNHLNVLTLEEFSSMK